MPVSMPPVDEARTVFRDLGYTVDGDGHELRAQRKWRTVHVTAVEDVDRCTLADGGDPTDGYRCFVTYREHATELLDRLESLELPFDWALIGVDGDDYDVVRPTS